MRDFEGLSPYFGAHAKAAKDAKESRMGVRIPHAREISECGPTTSRMCGTSKGCRPTVVLTQKPLRKRRNPEWGLGSRGCGIPHAREIFPRGCGTRLRVNFGCFKVESLEDLGRSDG